MRSGDSFVARIIKTQAITLSQQAAQKPWADNPMSMRLKSYETPSWNQGVRVTPCWNVKRRQFCIQNTFWMSIRCHQLEISQQWIETTFISYSANAQPWSHMVGSAPRYAPWLLDATNVTCMCTKFLGLHNPFCGNVAMGQKDSGLRVYLQAVYFIPILKD